MDSKSRFSNRVDDYVKFRPTYPDPLIDYVIDQFRLAPETPIADIGSGTGIFTRLLLARGLTVYGVEPNEKMRQAAEAEAVNVRKGRYQSVDGSAEHSTLPDSSVSAIFCAQAFHWFDAELTKREFQRIVKPDGAVALVWNKRDTIGSPFAVEYEALLHRYAPDYKDVGHMKLTDDDFRRFFRERVYNKVEFPHEQFISREQLLGRAASSSYTPSPGTSHYEPFIRELYGLFDQHQTEGRVPFHYTTELYYGQV
ncbi:SAM-dependent methyltransferase [Paenibacillus phyllosphaerae]|uniref:SAM-dependent methyltransferase n=1 Tax=Paenibacillus phyllosphaerae TaxID=274593 RepID=A0A7W5AXL3_9BACL|nr:class I SAM-dependent methyltransferase [Paenibacillus phyllosphaerae]MBB3110001.1 SAM-dependent methyltransferase [Paenibacillus phyllosphaerae]